MDLQTANAPVANEEGPGAAPATYLAEIKAELKKQWPEHRTITVVCHGHSVPAGLFEWPELNSPKAYPHQLFLELKKCYPTVQINVIVTAVGGEDSVSGAERFERDVLSLRPDVITIDYALNDRDLPVEASQSAWEKMIARAQERSIKVLLLTPTPDQRTPLNDPDDPLNQLAQQVQELAAEHSVGLVDSFAAFNQRVKAGVELADLMSSPNHPSAVGHALVVTELMKWFRP